MVNELSKREIRDALARGDTPGYAYGQQIQDIGRAYLASVTNPNPKEFAKLTHAEEALPDRGDPLIARLTKIADKHRGYPDADLGSWKLRGILNEAGDRQLTISKGGDGMTILTIDGHEFALRLTEKAAARLDRFIAKHPETVATPLAAPVMRHAEADFGNVLNDGDRMNIRAGIENPGMQLSQAPVAVKGRGNGAAIG